ncbi:hypothetical protein GPALN_010578 [Globodera pallida]|nr:hypothetical protein GPALN_010578 [Globodera pallida]
MSNPPLFSQIHITDATLGALNGVYRESNLGLGDGIEHENEDDFDGLSRLAKDGKVCPPNAAAQISDHSTPVRQYQKRAVAATQQRRRGSSAHGSENSLEWFY